MKEPNLLEHLTAKTRNKLLSLGSLGEEGDTFFSPQDRTLMKNIAKGGLLAGSGVGLSLILARHLKNLQQDAHSTNPDRADDDIVYIDLPRSKSASLRAGLGITGGVIGGLTTAALINELYTYFKKKQLYKQIDEEQRILLQEEQDLEKQINKQASFVVKRGNNANPMEWASGASVALPLLAVLASGAVTYAGLRKHFPTEEKLEKDRLKERPKRVRIRYVDSEESDNPDMEKYSHFTYELGAHDEDVGFEYLATKVACCYTHDYEEDLFATLVKQAAYGRLEALGEEFINSGAEGVERFDQENPLDASIADLTNTEKCAAISLLIKNPATRELTKLAAMGAYCDQFPYQFSKVAAMDERTRNTLYSMAPLMGYDQRGWVLLGDNYKEAAANPELRETVANPEIEFLKKLLPMSDKDNSKLNVVEVAKRTRNLRV